jgi:hypothetical protein
MHELMWGRRVSGLGAKAASHLTEIEGADLAALKQVFARALAENPAERFGTALEFAEALQTACPDIAMAPEPAPPAKRRPAREEPRLPLDPPPLVIPAEPDTPAAEVAQGVPPPLAVDAGELRRDMPKPERREGGSPAEPEADLKVRTTDADLKVRTTDADLKVRPTDADLAVRPATDAAAEIVYHAAPEIHDSALYDPPTRIPPGLITGDEVEPLSALEVSRTAVWPLVLALGVGVAVGFGGGFFVGSHEQTPAPAVASGRGITEAAVPAAPAKSELRSQKSEAEVPKVEAPAPPANAEPRTPNPERRTANVAAEPAGRLVVRSRPAGARVSVDGKDRGVTPAAIRDLARGAHRVKVTRDGYAPEERHVVITPSRPTQSLTVALARSAAPPLGQTAAPAARSTGALAVDSRPAGARVFIDDKLVGTTPMALPSVPAGSHAIRLEHDGYRNWSSSIRVTATEQNRVTASLER